MSNVAAIHIAYAVSRRGGATSYRARAFVVDRGVRHSFAIGIGDSAAEAKREVIGHIQEMHRRDGLTAPLTVIEFGKLHGAIVDAGAF